MTINLSLTIPEDLVDNICEIDYYKNIRKGTDMYHIDSPEFQRVWFWLVVGLFFVSLIVVGSLETPH